MKIYVVRHGIAVEGLVRGISRDSERPLTDEGVAETEMVARALKKMAIKPDLIVASPLVRTQQTAKIIHAELGGEFATSDTLAPGISIASVYKFLKKFEKAHDIFLVGHEPDVGEIVKDIVGGGFEFTLPFAKAGVCCVETSDLPATMPGTMKWLITPNVFKLLTE
ncbi:phosphohistidine phosphatase SixA [Candidatus Obscuribacterales bacterium]|nr:phosphohistidine phosphatase SixA [Candidatus Obscuribacterales bacterium]MBX3153840.1 phosphohistidine phosphatase SixA [Candidatus Obscuribacterales bacterium]